MIKQLQNKRKKLISQQKQEERKREIDDFMKKEQSLKAYLQTVQILQRRILSAHHISKHQRGNQSKNVKNHR